MNKGSLVLFIIIILIPIYFFNINRLTEVDLDELHEKYDMNFLDPNHNQYAGAEILWVTKSKKEFEITPPINLNGKSYIESDDVLYEINLKTGKPSFNFKRNSLDIEQDNNVAHYLKDPIANPNIKIEEDSNSFKVINKTQNEVLWQFNFDLSQVDYIATQNILFVTTHDSYRVYDKLYNTVNYLYSFDIESGEKILEYKDENNIIDIDNVWNLENHLLFRIGFNIILIDKNTGKILWSYPYRETISSKQVYDGFLYIVDKYGTLTAINLFSGQTEWERKDLDVSSYDFVESQNINSTFPATFLQDKMFISRHGGLTVLDKGTGKTIWEFSIEDNADERYINFAEPVVIKNSVLYASSTNGLLFAIKID